MATERAKQTIRVVTQEQMLCEDDGNVLLPLERVRDKYNAKAAELKEKAFGDNRKLILAAAETYTRMADSVERLISMMSDEVTA